jgi:hypothetical protein
MIVSHSERVVPEFLLCRPPAHRVVVVRFTAAQLLGEEGAHEVRFGLTLGRPVFPDVDLPFRLARRHRADGEVDHLVVQPLVRRHRRDVLARER